jgi:hypothetical protein
LELRDLIVTPLVLIAVYGVAYLIRPHVTDSVNRKYFFPALTVRVIGALAVGFLYQFYYGGGDTFNFHTHGSRIIWEAFTEDFGNGVKLLFSGPSDYGLYKYTNRIWYSGDPQSFFVVRVATLFDLFTFSTYSATAVLFGVLSFIGAWLMFNVFYKLHPDLHKWIAITCLFIPTVFFWGSGIFKDTLTLSALGVALYCVYRIFITRKISLTPTVGLIFSVWVIFSIKKYILLCFLPAILIWIFSRGLARIRSLVLKILLVPVAALPVFFLIYYTLLKVGEDDPRYNVNKLAETAHITAYDIRYGWGARTGEGSGYTLGELDGTWQSMVKLGPAAVNVSLFRPYLWEVSNLLMLFSAIESFAFLMITIYVLYKSGFRIGKALQKPEVIFCLGFSLVFAFAVGVSTYNFGSLSRYKIPLLPFYATGLIFIYAYSRKVTNPHLGSDPVLNEDRSLKDIQ